GRAPPYRPRCFATSRVAADTPYPRPDLARGGAASALNRGRVPSRDALASRPRRARLEEAGLVAFQLGADDLPILARAVARFAGAAERRDRLIGGVVLPLERGEVGTVGSRPTGLVLQVGRLEPSGVVRKPVGFGAGRDEGDLRRPTRRIGDGRDGARSGFRNGLAAEERAAVDIVSAPHDQGAYAGQQSGRRHPPEAIHGAPRSPGIRNATLLPRPGPLCKCRCPETHSSQPYTNVM